MSDYVGSETIDSYHIDASSEWALRCDSVEIDSVQAEENLCIFGVACEKLQIPRSCIATSKDFKEKNVRACVLNSNIAVQEDRVDSRSVRHAWFGLQPSQDGVDHGSAEEWAV